MVVALTFVSKIFDAIGIMVIVFWHYPVSSDTAARITARSTAKAKTAVFKEFIYSCSSIVFSLKESMVGPDLFTDGSVSCKLSYFL